MTERDKIIQELVDAHIKGFLIVERPGSTVDVYDDPEAEVDGVWLEACGHPETDNDVTLWLYAHMDNPPSHISKIKRSA